MTTTTRATKAGLIERTISTWIRANGLDLETRGMVTETRRLKTETSLYTLTRIPADFGVGVEVRKDGGETHQVNLDRFCLCDCAGATYNAGDCRHVTLCREALRRGLI